LIIGSNAVQAAITEVDAPMRREFTADLLIVDFGVCFPLSDELGHWKAANS